MTDAFRFCSSPADAYRNDAQHAASLSDDEDAWLAIASLVHLAALVQSANQRRRNLAPGPSIRLRSLVGQEFIRDYVLIEWRGKTICISPLLVLAREIQVAGGLHLAGVLLDDLVCAAPDVRPKAYRHSGVVPVSELARGCDDCRRHPRLTQRGAVDAGTDTQELESGRPRRRPSIMKARQ